MRTHARIYDSIWIHVRSTGSNERTHSIKHHSSITRQYDCIPLRLVCFLHQQQWTHAKMEHLSMVDGGRWTLTSMRRCCCRYWLTNLFPSNCLQFVKLKLFNFSANKSNQTEQHRILNRERFQTNDAFGWLKPMTTQQENNRNFHYYYYCHTVHRPFVCQQRSGWISLLASLLPLPMSYGQQSARFELLLPTHMRRREQLLRFFFFPLFKIFASRRIRNNCTCCFETSSPWRQTRFEQPPCACDAPRQSCHLIGFGNFLLWNN